MKRIPTSAAFALALGLSIGAVLSTPARAQDQPEQQAPSKSTQAWIDDLSSDDFATREAATEALSKLGPKAAPALEEARQSSDPEVRWRAEKALEAIRAGSGSKSAETPKGPTIKRGGPGSAPGQGIPDIFEELEKQLEGEMPGMSKMIEEMFKGGPMKELLGPEFGEAFEEMEKALRDLERPDAKPRQQQPGSFQSFRAYRLKDGKWEAVEPNGGPVARKKLGVRVQPISPLVKSQLQLSGKNAVSVETVQRGSLADKAGLVPYDIITGIDGQELRAATDLEAITNNPGEHSITILRGGETHTLSIVSEGDAPKKNTPFEKKPEPKEELRKF
ncbi:MAG: HEAT repeat domain-containing protein [Planctomycetota bacterium]|jgi:hypothetical protein